MKRSRAAALLTALAFAALGAGCGTQQTPDLANGKRLFTGEGRCAQCHVLGRAGSGANIGPNLDEAFGPSRRDGLGEGTVAGVVRQQIDNVRRGSVMPPDLVTGQDARDVAAYVASAAGVSGEDPGGGGPPAGGSDPGRRLFTESGCGSCHALYDAGTSANVGPSLNTLGPSARSLNPSNPDDYVRESIENPEAYVVKGYPSGVMPAYKGKLSRAEIDTLVTYLNDNGG